MSNAHRTLAIQALQRMIGETPEQMLLNEETRIAEIKAAIEWIQNVPFIISAEDARMEPIKQRPETITARALQLIADAEASGVVITISTQPREPLAMRNYKMVADFRQVRA